MSPWNSIVVLYFKGAYDVISVTMATLQVHKKALKTNSVTYRFYFFVEKLSKLFTFSGSMKKIYLVEFNIS